MRRTQCALASGWWVVGVCVCPSRRPALPGCQSVCLPACTSGQLPLIRISPRDVPPLPLPGVGCGRAGYWRGEGDKMQRERVGAQTTIPPIRPFRKSKPRSPTHARSQTISQPSPPGWWWWPGALPAGVAPFPHWDSSDTQHSPAKAKG